MERRLEYYLNLPYKIEIEPIPEDEGGGFVARLSDFGKFGIIGDGETIEEALQNLKEAKKIRFEEWFEEGLSIPEPNKETNIEGCSGKFVIRIPKYLHFALISYARDNGVSLNQFVLSLLSAGTERHQNSVEVKKLIREVKTIKKHLFDMKDKLESKLSMDLNILSEMKTSEDYEYSKAA